MCLRCGTEKWPKKKKDLIGAFVFVCVKCTLKFDGFVCVRLIIIRNKKPKQIVKTVLWWGWLLKSMIGTKC